MRQGCLPCGAAVGRRRAFVRVIRNGCEAYGQYATPRHCGALERNTLCWIATCCAGTQHAALDCNMLRWNATRCAGTQHMAKTDAPASRGAAVRSATARPRPLSPPQRSRPSLPQPPPACPRPRPPPWPAQVAARASGRAADGTAAQRRGRRAREACVHVCLLVCARLCARVRSRVRVCDRVQLYACAHMWDEPCCTARRTSSRPHGR